MLDLCEFVEDPMLIVGGNADAGVLDGKHDRLRRGRQMRRDTNVAVLRVPERVRDEVAQDLDTLPSSVRISGRPSGSSKTG